MLAETSLHRIGKGVEDIVQGLSCPGGAIPAKKGYIFKSVVRKLMLACPAASASEADWANVSRLQLQAWSPDETHALTSFGEKGNAQSMSMLLFDRPDWGLLISMWACLCKPAVALLAGAKYRPSDLQAKDLEGIVAAVATVEKEMGTAASVQVAVKRWLQGQEPGEVA